ncbi:MAG: DUF5309 domain-containing protein, partial [Phycisphaerales bacterium]|nr:DUF5309 domain-containing protein [Phycisphaerales bacterium]
LVSIVSPHETPLLDALGDPLHAATSTRHEWLEDELLPNVDEIYQSGLSDGAMTTTMVQVNDGTRFRAGDQIRPKNSTEIILVTAVNGNAITMVRGYGNTVKKVLVDGQPLTILGNAALEAAEAGEARFNVRTRKSNYTQIFSAAVQVSGTEAAVRHIGVDDEMDYQKTNRLRELLRDLENTALNGVAPTSTPQGSSTVRRTMRGIIASLTSNLMQPGAGLIPSGAELSEAALNAALQTIWEASGARADLIVCGGNQKRRINGFIQASQRFSSSTETFKNMVSVYESDFGVCRVVMSRYMPPGTVLFLDSSRVSVVPLVGRSFQFKPLAVTGDYESGEIVGEYTVELRNEKGHGLLRNLAA